VGAETRTSTKNKGTASAVLFVLVALAIGLAGWGLWKGSRERSSTYFQLRGETMGTTWAVKLAAADQSAADELRRQIEAELDAVDVGMSTYRPDSELSRLNEAPAGEHALSDELAFVLGLAAQVWKGTDGAFDPTVGPLVDAWGFGPKDVEAAPSQADIDALRAQVGFDRIRLGATKLEKPDAALRIDLSAIAKGYAVDQVAEHLDGVEVEHYMVEVGGEVRTHGEGPSGAWRIGIEEPASDAAARRSVHRVVELSGTARAMATSGDYRNYREQDGVRVSHTIDPRTGRPITHALASVSVVHESCALADAWATGLNVLGPKQGPKVAKDHDLAAYFLIREGDGFRAEATPAFEGLLAPTPSTP
jgi:thiamine biosynthesis lipoprotein